MSLLLDFFVWLDGSTTRFWTLAWSIFSLWCLSALMPGEAGGRRRRWNHPAVYAGLMLLMIAAFRWPGIGRNASMGNPDESQLVAGALTMLHHGQYWGRVDCGSSGPLDMLPLLLPRLLGLPLDFTGARLVGLLLLWGACSFGWLTLRHVAGDRTSRLLIMPLPCVIAFVHYGEFVQYSSEQAPVLLVALAVWLTVTAFAPDGSVVSRTRLGLAGAALSMLPFTKLQAAPFGPAIGLCALVWIFLRRESSVRSRLINAGCLAGGAVLALGLMAAEVLRGGAGADFYQTYIRTNLNYAQARNYPWSAFGERLGYMVNQTWGFEYYLVPALIVVALALFGWPALTRPARRPAIFGAVLFCTGFFVVAAPGREFEHYLLFLLLPVSLFVGLLSAGLVASFSRPLLRGLGLAVVTLAGVGPQVYYRSHDANPYHGYLLDSRDKSAEHCAQHILRYTQPGDTLTVWGWMPEFYVQTQLPQGTQDAHTERQISANPQQAYFRQRFFAALEKNRPAVFVDAVGEGNFGYGDRNNNTYETLPWLRDFITANYTFSVDLDGSRIYVRNDRWNSRPR